MFIRKKKQMNRERKTSLSFSLFYKNKGKCHRICKTHEIRDINYLFKLIPQDIKDNFEHRDIINFVYNPNSWESEFKANIEKEANKYINSLKTQLNEALKHLIKNRFEFLRLLSNLQKNNNGWGITKSELDELYIICARKQFLYCFENRKSLFTLIEIEFSKYKMYQEELIEAMNREFVMLEQNEVVNIGINTK